MGKKNKGALIDDRVIRQPMDQMRRKLKYRDKERRKETRQGLRTEQEMNERFDLTGSFKKHDSDLINKLKSDQ